MEDKTEITTEKKRTVLWRRLGLAVMGLILGVGVYFANAREIAGNQLPMPFGFGAAIVLSGSMEPALKVNDVIVVHQTQDYQVGDIVVYQSGHVLVSHRIVQIDGETVVTQGDANNTSDDPIRVSDIKGVVAARIPAAGIFVYALRKPVLIVVVFLCILLFSRLSFRREKDEDEKRLEEMREEIRRLREEQENAAKKDT